MKYNCECRTFVSDDNNIFALLYQYFLVKVLRALPPLEWCDRFSVTGEGRRTKCQRHRKLSHVVARTLKVHTVSGKVGAIPSASFHTSTRV